MSSALPQEPTPVVFLHGFFGTADDWDDVAWELADDRPVAAVDLPGHEPADEPLDEDEAALPTDLGETVEQVRAWGLPEYHAVVEVGHVASSM